MMDFHEMEMLIDEPTPAVIGFGGLLSIVEVQPTYQRVAPDIAAQHTMRAQAILSLGDTTKHQAMALQHLEAAFVAANPGWRA